KMPNCVTCSQTEKYQCISCEDKFVVNNYQCECPSYLYQNNSSTCDECYNIKPKCKMCQNYGNYGAECKVCYPPFELIEGSCVECQSYTNYFGNVCVNNNGNCELQNGENNCLKCQTDYHLRNKTCEIFENKNLCETNSKITCENCGNGITTTGNCEESNCKYYYKNKTTTICLQCNDGSNFDTSGVCNNDNKDDLYKNSVIFKCKIDQYLNNNNLCHNCKDDQTNSIKCKMVNSKIHGINCDNNNVINTKEDMCILKNKCDTVDGNDCVSCVAKTNTYIKENVCINCGLENCLSCLDGKCINCLDGYLLTTTNQCETKETYNCQQSKSNKCIKCLPMYIKVEKNTIDTQYCKLIGNDVKYATKSFINDTVVIFECNNGFLLYDGNCTKENDQLKQIESETDRCQIKSSKGCISCLDGYYLTNGSCNKCENNCTTCFNSTHCLSCRPELEFLNKDNTCERTEDFFKKCKKEMPNMIGCALCQEGYYREKSDCVTCDSTCAVCKDLNSCITCKLNYFLIPSEMLTCQSYSGLVGCADKTQFGCERCEGGYYLDSYIPRCKTCIENCTKCIDQYSCEVCQKDNIYVNNKCVHYTHFMFCIAAFNGECLKCSQGKQLSDDRKSCEDTPNTVLITSLSVTFVVIVIIVVIVLLFTLSYLYNYFGNKKKMQNVCVFKMKRSNITFYDINEWLVSNKKTLVFVNDDNENSDIPVGKETREVLCVGNKSKNAIKIQFSVLKGCENYNIRTEPSLVNLKSGEACEFEMFLTPICSCNIEDKIVCVGLDIQNGLQMIQQIQISAKTQMTTHLDYHELHEEKRLGEGSFGIVYLGEFRGYKVAIKKMKEGCNDEIKMKEFEKEVNMLDKFRSDYLVHFYGAVFIPNKICMVTEFAQFGSLNDLIKNKKKITIQKEIKIKVMNDMANGLLYLHTNGIVHRDIKPDNLLVFSLDINDKVNAKLTDFGSARNINLLMTNMTFTKGVGTPVYMAPEVLKKEKYKKSADIYSFGVTLYETLKWGDAYDKNVFKFPWKIAEFVISGKRLERNENMSDSQYELIQKCWSQQPDDRPNINEVVNLLETK
ncbi:protein kinase domain containing protein, partial [Entamoeba invadens IP1]